jgi:hypothetical protein
MVHIPVAIAFRYEGLNRLTDQCVSLITNHRFGLPFSAITYSNRPIGPMYKVTSTKPHFITAGSGLAVEPRQMTSNNVLSAYRRFEKL